ncbi:MAG TPA: imelysin family protein [Polyangiaceae bacterium]|nr:imelysin family protein [Polyangiaceae bacterium]
MKGPRTVTGTWVLLSAALALLGCRERSAEKTEPLAFDEKALALGKQALTTYADIAFAAYSDAANGAKELLVAVDAFTGAPSSETLQAARQAWIAARKPYLQTEVFRFYDGPIDSVETLVNTWPIDESYVEAGVAGKAPGILENIDKYPTLTPELLASLNAKEGETSISTGYHVIEFLLWGRDTRADGPGDRPYTDFVTSGTNGELARRRAVYLHIASELLLRQLEEVRDAWDPARADRYRTKFLSLSAKEGLGLVVKGMGSLSGPELSGERLTVPYETKDQENEHSCFSDTTSSDVAFDALGIENVGLGRYVRVNGDVVKGTSLIEFIAAHDRNLSERLRAELGSSVAAARAIPSPFDQAIVGTDDAPGRTKIWATIQALQRQTDTLAQVASAFDLRLSLAAPRTRQ